MTMRAVMAAVAAMATWAGAAAAVEERVATPAERRVAEARAEVEKKPSAYGWSDLALALARRARETADPAFYEQAAAAAQRSLELAPDNVDGLKARAWVLLGQHRFAEARDLAQALNRRVPDDVFVYGLLTDAHLELGQYQEAERACQWMLDLRPGNVPGLARAAYLRELFGDVEGALEAMNMAFQQTPAAETEEVAWFSTQVAHLHLLAGRPAEAEQALKRALEFFPGYHYALAGLAKVRTAQGRHREAAALLQQRYDAAPHPENLFDLGEALVRAGRRGEARRVLARFEREARAESEGQDNANRELIYYYVDHARRPSEALRLARREASRRRDVFTLGALAWALHASGRTREARTTLQEALQVGVKDPRLLAHARVLGAAAPGSPTASIRRDPPL